MNQQNLIKVDWSKIPAPKADVSLDHLNNYQIPEIKLQSTKGEFVYVGKLSGLSVIYIYPMTGQPNVALPKDWDEIPGARGCTPQSCSFRDNFSELTKLNVVVPRERLAEAVFGFDDDVLPTALESHVSRLRARLAAVAAGVAIHPVRGVGYMLDRA